jgi:hypothetical protein
MAFCMNCGKQLPDGAKFCDGCGTAIGQVSNQHNRQFEYEGTIHKCPNCGDIIDAFESVCEACGYEIRDRKASNSIREFAIKIQEIERTREKTKQNPLKTLYFGQPITDTDEKIVSLISNFPIPNSKEDLYEFIVLSHSNINVDAYNTGGNQFKECDARLAISNAWKSKLEQAYQKAKLVFAGDRRMDDIQTMYDTIHKSIKKAKSKSWKFVGLLYAIVIGFMAIVFILISTATSSNEKKEIARLEAIVVEVQDALERKEYKLALNNADSIDYQRYGIAMERKWDIQREYWVDKVIEEAAKEGIVLEYTQTPDIDNANKKTNDSNDDNSTISQETLDQFTNGYDNPDTQNNSQQTEDVREPSNDMENVKNSESTETNETNPSVGFEEGTFASVSVKGFSFNIPNYWSEEGSKNEYLQYYAEKGGKVVMLSIAYPKESDDDYDVSFDGLYADNENMIKALGAMFTDGDVYDHEIFESEHGVKGILYRFTFNQKINWFKKVDGSGYCFCFPSDDDRRWFYVVLLHTNNVASDDYKDDYMTLISTIKGKS